MRITISISPEEHAALIELAQRERRDLRRQAAYLVRQSLERLGFLQSFVVASPTTRMVNPNEVKDSE